MKFDRFINPFDGSRRRNKSEGHKTVKDYNRAENKKIEIIETLYDEDLLYEEIKDEDGESE